MQHCAKAITGENNQLNKVHIILLNIHQSSVRAKRIRFIRDVSYIFGAPNRVNLGTTTQSPENGNTQH